MGVFIIVMIDLGLINSTFLRIKISNSRREDGRDGYMEDIDQSTTETVTLHFVNERKRKRDSEDWWV